MRTQGIRGSPETRRGKVSMECEESTDDSFLTKRWVGVEKEFRSQVDLFKTLDSSTPSTGKSVGGDLSSNESFVEHRFGCRPEVKRGNVWSLVEDLRSRQH